MSRLFIGTSGWSYAHWEGELYPKGTPSYQYLMHYLNHFDTVELNSSYYHWPHDSTFQSWHLRVPQEFTLSVKAPGALTHRQRLHAPEAWLERIARGLNFLKENAGPLLIQTPPSLSYDGPRLRYFLEQVSPSMRMAMEFRHPSWHNESVFSQLEDYGIAYCIMSGANLPCILRATTDFVYVRLHGPSTEALYADSYSEDSLDWWFSRIDEWREQGRDVYVYFNNDGDANAVRNARALRSRLNR